ncbi:MAG: hypothetical protein WC856_11025, partial [Methylococcaceae bacterium]
MSTIGSFFRTHNTLGGFAARQSGINGAKYRGVAIFAKAFLGIPAQQAAKITRPLMPSVAPAVLSLSFATQQGDSSHHPNDSTRFRKACIFTTLKLRENTCPIAS